MIFVDGTNLLAGLGRQLSIELNPHNPPDVALRLCRMLLNRAFVASLPPSSVFVGAFWFGSYVGSTEVGEGISTVLHDPGQDAISFTFRTELFPKEKRRNGEKGVDVSLAIEMLTNAFHKNMDIAVLVSGDEDYVRLVEETRRHGCIVGGAYFPKYGLAKAIRLAFDDFVDLSAYLIDGSPYTEVLGFRDQLRAASKPLVAGSAPNPTP